MPLSCIPLPLGKTDDACSVYVGRAVRALLLLPLLGCAAAGPPSLEYGTSRTSTAWLDTPMGKVPVDQGLDWQGVRVHLSMLGDLIAVDPATGRILWTENVGAFWNGMTFRELDSGWAVELRPRRTEEEGGDLAQHHDLRTGKLVKPKELAPSGTLVPVLKQWHGRKSRLAEPFVAVVTNEPNRRELVRRMFDGIDDAPKVEPVDFDRECLLAVSEGACWCVSGISAAEVREDPERILVRLYHHTYQILTSADDPGPPPDRPFGIIVIPARPGKTIVLETNRQRYISGPPIWKEKLRFTPDPDRELEAIPR